jgi:predicted nucleic acid-binding protein
VHPQARALFGRIANADDPLLAYISVVTVAEMLVRPIRSGGRDLRTVHELVTNFPSLFTIDVDRQVVLQAANIRALTSLTLPDSLLVATALLSGCEAVISNDERWSRRLAPLYPQFRWTYLGQ